jgi:WD40 repeat protein
VTGEPVSEPLRGHTFSVTSVSFSPDSTCIVTGSEDNTVRLWDAGTGELVGEPLLGHTDAVWSVSFSPDGTRIVTGSRDNTVRLWDAGTLEPVGEPLRGHTSSVWSVSFSPDGTRIVTGSHDNTVRLWHAVMSQPSQYCAVSHSSAFSDEHRVMHPVESTTPITFNTSNNYVVCFSPNSSHALRNTSQLMEETFGDDRSQTPFVLNVDSGWVVGPKHQLLFWVPPASRHLLWSTRTLFVIPRSTTLDLSRMRHGQHWKECREE